MITEKVRIVKKIMSQVDEVLPGGIGDNNSGDSGDVEQLALVADRGCNLPVVSSSAEPDSAMEKITTASVTTEAEAEVETSLLSGEETGLNATTGEATESVAVALAKRAHDGYEPCDPLIILNLFQSLSATTNSLELQMKINLHVSIA